MRKMLALTLAVFAMTGILMINATAGDIDELIDVLPDGVVGYLPGGAEDADGIVENFSADYLLGVVVKAASAVFPETARSLSGILALIILSSVLGVIRDGTGSGELRDILSYVCTVCVCGAAYEVTGSVLSVAGGLITTVGTMMRCAIPAMAALSAASGGVTFAAVCSGILYGAITVLESLCEGMLFPLMKICVCISMGSSALGNQSLGEVISPLKKAASFMLGLIMLIFSAVLGFRGIVASSVDSAAIKGVKFAVSGIVPIVGGAVGDAMSSIFGSMALVRSTFGTASAVILSVAVIVPILRILIYKTMFDLVSATAGLVGMKSEGKFLSDMGSVCGVLLAVSSCISVFFIIGVGIFAAGG